MDKSKANLIIDAVMFLCVMAIAGIGCLTKFILLPGRETAAVYGRKVDLFLFGMDRHVWGTIHFITACVFLGLLTAHIVLHWNMIVSVYRRLMGSTVARYIVAIIILISGIFLVVSPFFVKPDVQQTEQKGRQHHEKMNY
ncbi:MAG TPA: DUF4405 domain-containing protein [Candidatus Wunengus sp. YC60]|uniref:DUF4405 domain-containing protein n=1 Tax=Candidatus Wunengus sp. YC60 TaxID=3367697 RepID=UPI0040275FC3